MKIVTTILLSIELSRDLFLKLEQEYSKPFSLDERIEIIKNVKNCSFGEYNHIYIEIENIDADKTKKLIEKAIKGYENLNYRVWGSK